MHVGDNDGIGFICERNSLRICIKLWSEADDDKLYTISINWNAYYFIGLSYIGRNPFFKMLQLYKPFLFGIERVCILNGRVLYFKD